jgi:Fe-Mn family superoxide dismutase
MPFALPSLPYRADALEPFMSARTLNLHHGKHHQSYVTKLNELTGGTAFAKLPLEEVVRSSHSTAATEAIFNNAAQHWNHCAFWLSMKPGGGGKVPASLERRLIAQFGSVDAFKSEFVAKGLAQFGAGWVWLVETAGVLRIEKSPNAITPIITGDIPLLACDLWEHAYYVDYENRRADFLQAFLNHLVDWDTATSGRLMRPLGTDVQAAA